MANIGSSAGKFSQLIQLDPGNVTAGTISVQDFAVSGLDPDAPVSINAPSLETGILIIHQQVPSAGLLRLAFWNTTGGSINPASQRFSIVQP